eukprot:TRINITY_DN1171_c1_g1_i2.p1 TRINITY_DN1171_c1_g1~~TRINITY_DN1171_c1_g1_i2.p1  ORF type:complete len:744 (+),score=190.76 TRINITY_DN1171_c1_g1_i2:2457-4688(+)
MQHKALHVLASRQADLTCPRPVCTAQGEEIVSVTNAATGTIHFMRMLTYVSGIVFAEIANHPVEMLNEFGAAIARLDQALAVLRHPFATIKRSIWDLKHFLEIEQYTPHIADASRRAIVEHFLAEFKRTVSPVAATLRQTLIRGDANDYNVLLDNSAGRPRVSGLLDFGDMVETYQLCECAISAAYATFYAENPLADAVAVVAGYHRVIPLTEEEIELVFLFVCARICQSVTMSAHAQFQNPHNAYLTVSQNPGWAALTKLYALKPREGTAAFRIACGFALRSEDVEFALAKQAEQPEAEEKEEHWTTIQRPVDVLHQLRKQYVGYNVALNFSDKPIKIVRGEKQYLFDEHGKAYLDTVNNVTHVGHCHPYVVRALQNQAAILNTNSRFLHDHVVSLAKRITQTLPAPLSVVYFVCSGTEATELAVRIARTHTKKQQLLVIDGAYHGNSTTVIDMSSYKFNAPGGEGQKPYIAMADSPCAYRGKHRGSRDDEKIGEKYAKDVAALIKKEKRSGQIAAFFAESILGCAGQVIPPKGYLKRVFNTVREQGGVCVSDEVQVGFGRAGTHMWMFETHDVVPDIVTMGKPMGNGHPIAAVVTTPEIARSFNNGMEYFNTYGGNPVACAVALSVLDVIENEGLQKNALRVGGFILAGLREMQEKHKVMGDVRGIGLYIGVEFVKDRSSLEPATDDAVAFKYRMKEKYIIVSTDGPLNNIVKIKPPMIFSLEDAATLLRVFDETLTEMNL